MKGNNIFTICMVVCLVLGGLSVIGSETIEGQEGVPVNSIEVAVESDMEAGVGAVYDGDYDLFMHSIDGPVYMGLREEWRMGLETWTTLSSYNNLFLNPAHEGKGTPEMEDAIVQGWIDEPEEVQWLANDVDGEWTVNPFAHNDIRFAMQHLNREKMIEELLDGFGDPRYGFMSAHLDVWRERFVESIEENYGMSPDGDWTKVEEIVEDAMLEIQTEVAFGDVSGSMDDGWFYNPPDGEEHQIEIKIVGRVEDWRLDLAGYLASNIQDLGFDAWVEPVDSATAIPMVFFGMPEPYDNLDYHIYTGGWMSDIATYYQEGECSRMYAPWYGFMQTYGSGDHWQYDDEGYYQQIGPSDRVRDDWIEDPHAGQTVADMDQMTMELFMGQVETEDQYWDMKVAGSQMGFEESVRVFLLTRHSFYPYNPDQMLGAVQEDISGYDTYFGPRTMRTDDGHLDTAVFTETDRPFMDNWNLYGGSADVYGEYQRRMAREYGSWNHPHTGLPMEVNTYWSEGRDTDPFDRQGNVEKDYEWVGGDLIENIEIPETAVDYVPGIEAGEYDWNVVREWWTRDELISEGLIEDEYAAVKATLDVHEEHVWHDGTDFSLRHVMANYARSRELGNPAGDPYLSSHDAATSPWWDTIHAIEWNEEDGTYTMYGDYTFPLDDLIGSHYAMFPETHPLTYEGWDHLHGATEIYDAAGIVESYDYEPGEDNWIHQLSKEQNEDLVTIMETMISEEYLPPYLDADNNAPIPMTMDEVETELNSLIDFIQTYDHSFIGTGPFYIEEYTADHHLILERWDDHGYPFEGEEAEGVEFPYGYWAAQFEAQEVRLDSISAPTTVNLGEEFDADGTGHFAELYPDYNELSLTEENMENYRFTIREDLGGEIMLEVPADDIELEPQDTFSEFFATIPTEDVERGGHYSLQLEAMGIGDPVYTTMATPIILSDPDVGLTALDWSIPEEVDVGEEGNIWAEVENTGEEDDTARLYLVDQETSEEEMVYDEEVPAGSTIDIDYDHTFDTPGEFVIELRDDEDRWVEEFGEVTVLGPDIEALNLDVDPTTGSPPLDVTIEVAAENNGTASGTIDLEVEDEVIETYEIDTGKMIYDTVEVTFENEGTYWVTFGDLACSVVVGDEPIAGVELNVPDEIAVGETATIEATVESFVEETTAHLYIAGVEEHIETLQGTGEHTFDHSHTFEQVGEVDVEVRNELNSIVLADTVTVLDMFELVIDSTEGGEVIEPGEESFEYLEGSEIVLEAVPEEGYHFVEWTGDNDTIDDPTANQTVITMNDDHTITAEFASTDYELTIDSTEGGEVLEPGEGTFGYQMGEVVSIEAEPEEGYQFLEWTGDIGTIEDPGAAHTTIEMLDNYTITAVFEEYVTEIYEITVNIEGESEVSVEYDDEVNLVEDSWTGNIEEGTVVTLTAMPYDGWIFVNWEGDHPEGEQHESLIEITMDENKELTAHFEELVMEYELTIESTAGGVVSEPGEGTFMYDHGTTVALEAVADEGHHFVEWTGDIDDIEDNEANMTTIEITDDNNITAVFEEEVTETYEVTIQIEGNGTVEIDPDQDEYEEGTVVTLTAVPHEGSGFSYWEGDHPAFSRYESQIEITMDSDKDLTAHFVEETEMYEFYVEVEGQGNVTVEIEYEGEWYEIEASPVEDEWVPDDLGAAGTEIRLTVNTPEGYEFVRWEGVPDDVDESRQQIEITLEEDMEITAVFEEERSDDHIGSGLWLILMIIGIVVLVLLIIMGILLKKKGPAQGKVEPRNEEFVEKTEPNVEENFEKTEEELFGVEKEE